MGDLGLPGSVVEMADDAPQKSLWEVRKAGLNIMMSLKGDGKPVSFIEDCAVPLEHLADYTDALTEVFARHGTRGTWYAHASVGTLHVRPILDMRRDGAAKMRSIAEEASALVRTYKGAFSGEHGDGLCRGEWIAWQFGPRARPRRSARSRTSSIPTALFNPGKIVDPPKMDDGALFRFPPPAAPRAVPDDRARAGARLVGVGRAERSAHRGDQRARHRRRLDRRLRQGGRDVQQQRPLPQVRRRHDVPELSRHARRAAPDARSREHAAARAVRPARRRTRSPSEAVHDALDLCVSCKGCKRECPTGVDMARMKIEFLAHYKKRARPLAQGPAGRAPARLRARAEPASPGSPTCATAIPGAAALGERLLGLAARRMLPRWRSDTFWRARDAERLRQRGATLAAARAGGKAAVLFVDTFNGVFESENALAAARVLKAAGYTLHTLDKARRPPLLRPHLSSTSGRWSTRRASAPARSSTRCCRSPRPASPIVGLEPSCLLTLRDEALALGLGDKARRSRAAGAAVRGVRRARGGRRAASRSTSTPVERADPRPRPLPPEGVRRGRADPRRAAAGPGRGADADRDLVLRHGRQLRLRGAPPGGLDARWPRRACCRRSARVPTRSSSPTARAAASRSRTARSARRCTSRASSSASCRRGVGMTWSIVARDADGSFGVAIASRFFAVGALCVHTRRAVGALSTQALMNPLYGPAAHRPARRGRRAGRRRRAR